jgi:site-specific recombinase XerD
MSTGTTRLKLDTFLNSKSWYCTYNKIFTVGIECLDMDMEILINQFCDYSICFRGFAKPTIRRYRQAIRYYCAFAQITTLDQVSETSLKELFIFGRTQRKWNPATFLSYYKSLIVFFRWCKDRGLLEKELGSDIEVPKLERKLPKKLTKQDAYKLLEIVYNYPYGNKFVQYRNHAIFSMFLFAGLRKKELLQLKLTDVDIENLTIFINQGKGSKDRIIPMNYTLAQSLKRYLDARKISHKTCPYFFTSFVNNIGFSEIGIRRLVDKIKPILGLSFSVHKLRHTFATLMLEGGCDIYSLSKMMGHADIKTTTIYLSATAEHLRGQMMKHPLNELAN